LNATIVLGITGGIAAYKIPELIRDLKRCQLDIEVVMTKAAQEFVTSTVLREVSGNPIHTGLFDPIVEWDVQHISLAQKADLVVVAPATANIIGKMANGIADDLLSSVLMATHAPILLAPAMNSGMYQNPAVQNNIQTLKKRGIHFIGPDEGDLLCGQAGIGRMSSINVIKEAILDLLTPKDMQNMHVLVTAGPTQEYWDPVRFFTNPSSGKMGFALARAAKQRGASVTLISGPVELPPIDGVDFISVRSAQEMFDAVMREYPKCNLSIMAAAPTDYRPIHFHSEKQKRNGERITICLEENPDIAQKIGKIKDKRFSVIFAAESTNLQQYAIEKLRHKNADLVVANNILNDGAGFRSNTNQVSLMTQEDILNLPTLPKEEVSHKILDAVLALQRGSTLRDLNHE
jgi:phosphopantothenoylcysteine decarboxylase/phosphopantothenate--cysteine ligase